VRATPESPTFRSGSSCSRLRLSPLAQRRLSVSPRHCEPARAEGGGTMIAAVYAHVTPRKEREKLAEYLK
jgi:hypothetical protein